MRPNFLFIGPDKSGSTWLYEILRGHPECYVPSIKDLYFFDRHYSRGIDWYLSFFADAPRDARAVGELSHDYLFSVEAPDRIARELPGVRLLTCLRQPTERTFSHYLYLVRSGFTSDPFESALESFPELIEHSRYHKHLTPYLERFPRSRIKVLFFDLLRSDARAFAREVFDFLDVSFVPDLPYEQRVLPASRPRSQRLARAMKLGADLARRLGYARLVGWVKHSRATRVLYRPYGRRDRPSMSPETRSRLNEFFRSDIEKLEEILATDLSAWLQPSATVES